MRTTLLVLCLVGCGSAGPSGVDVPGDQAEAATDVLAVDVSAPSDVARADDAGGVDAGLDATGPTDGPLSDVAAEDRAEGDGAGDADPCGSFLRQCNVNGHAECVDVTTGRTVGGVVVHCGMCDVMCAAGERCFERRCQRL